METSKIKPGKSVPENINVVIEIPAGSMPVKYELDKDSGALLVDRFISTSMIYPCNYGFVPNTLSEDGDPVDVLVFTPFPVIHGAVIACRPLGMLEMEDESGIDAKILAVPVSKLSKLYDDVKTIDDLPKATLASIKHFFEHYKDLEEGKWVKVKDWLGVESAHQEIEASIERYK